MVRDPILVGRFGAPHGVGGEVRLYSFTDDPGAIASYRPLLDESGRREFSILRLRPIKHNIFVAKIEGVDDRGRAGALVNSLIYVPRASFPQAGSEEFYYRDLIGLSVITEAGEELGSVANVLNFGAGDIMEIAPARGGEALLLPFTKEVFPRVDLKAGQLTVLPPVEIEAAPSKPQH
jgi:16S rRNA processing protein RimM